jgi:hypothetical protein
MTISPITVFEGDLPTETDPISFSPRMALLMEYITQVFGPEFAAAVVEMNLDFAAINGLATAAALSATNSQNSFLAMDKRLLGEKTANPTVDNQGAPLVAGAMYFNSAASEMRVRTSAGAWVATYLPAAAYLTVANVFSEFTTAQRAAALVNLGLTASASQINPLNGSLTIANAILLRENVNLVPNADNFTASEWRTAPSGFSGISYERTVGSDERGPFVDYRIFGQTTTANAVAHIFNSALIDIVNGQTYAASSVIERIAGSWAGVTSVNQSLTTNTSAGGFLGQSSDAKAAPLTGPANYLVSRAFTGATEARANTNILVVLIANTAIDITLRIRGVQLDLGATRRAYRYLPATPAQVRAALGIPNWEQTIQDVSASRAVSTTYQNTTGRPIDVYYMNANVVGYSIQMGPTAGTLVTVATGDNMGGAQMSQKLTVPSGWFYRVDGATAGIKHWIEVR